MSGRSAQIKIFDGGAELGVSRYRAQKKELLERKFSLENISFAQSEVPLEVQRGQHLLVQDDVFDVGRVLSDGVDDIVAECFFLIVPVHPRTQLVGSVLHEAGHDVFSRRRYGRIGQRRNHYVDVRASGVPAILGVVVSLLHVFDTGRN